MLSIIKAKTLYDNSTKNYRINNLDNPIKIGSFFIGETCFGQDLVEVMNNKVQEMSEERWNDMIFGSDPKKEKKSHFAFEPVLLRPASEQEISLSKQNRELSKTHQSFFEQKIKEYNIDLRIVNFHYTLAKDCLICVYTSPSRVDFRQFVKDVGSYLKQRIELLQVSIPSFSFFEGDMGVCGRSLCCSSFCSHQLGKGCSECSKGSVVKSSKNLGCCGKPKCCMVFE